MIHNGNIHNETIHNGTNGNQNRKFNLNRDIIDPNNPEHKTVILSVPRAGLPKSIDLRPMCPPIYDQGTLGSCTGNGLAAAFAFNEHKKLQSNKLQSNKLQSNKLQSNKSWFMPSRLFIYYNERRMEGTIPDDAGACIADGVKSIHDVGVCSESHWPYDITKFTHQPPTLLYKEAEKHRTNKYRRLTNDLIQLKTALAQNSLIVFGICVYESFQSDEVARTGIVPMPKPNEQFLGGHCIVLCGYNDETSTFIVRNSWGTQWGQQGYCEMPYAYINDENLSCDFWAIISNL